MPPFDIVRPLPELVAANAVRFGDRVAYRDEHESVSFVELAERTGRLAGQLVDLGVRPFDRVAVVLDGGVLAAVCHLAIARAGAIAVPLEPATAPRELAGRLDASGTVVAFAGPWLRAVRPAMTLVSDVAALPAPVGRARDDAGLDDLAVIFGPRGAMHSQRNILWPAATVYAAVAGMSADTEITWQGPVTGVAGYGLCVAAATALGATVRFGAGAQTRDLYATDEAGVIAVAWPDGGGLLPVPGVTVRIVTASGADAAAGQEGEVLVSGPGVMAGGYLDEPAASAEVLDGVWCRTGDLARRDSSGVLTRTGRVADVLVSHGERVRLPDVTSVLLAVSGVVAAEVTARDDTLVCRVIAEGGGVMRACRRRLAAFRVPAELYAGGELVATVAPPGGRATSDAAATLKARLVDETPARQQEALLELVLTEAAEVVADTFGTLVAADQPFKQLGFDSLGAVRLRNRLAEATGVELPATAAFDYPLPTQLATHLWGLLFGGDQDAGDALDRLTGLTAALDALDPATPAAQELTGRLRRLLTSWEGRQVTERDLASVTAEDMFALLDKEL